MRINTVLKRIGEGAFVAFVAALVVTLWRLRVPGGTPPPADQWRRVPPQPPAGAGTGEQAPARADGGAGRDVES